MSKIGIDIRMMGTEHGGIGRYVKELVLSLLNVPGSEKYVLFYNRELKNDPIFFSLKNHERVSLVECNIRHYSLKEQWKFYQILKNNLLPLVHFPNFNVPLAYNRPFVVTIHDMVHHKISGAKKSRLPQFLAYKQVIRHAAKNAKQVITVSEHSKRDIVRLLGVPSEKVNVVYEGASGPRPVDAESLTAVKAKYFLRRPYFLFVGVMERKKNLVNLARGFDAFIKQSGKDMDLVIAGRADPHYPEIRHKILDIKNRNRIVLTDYVLEEDLAALYAGAYAFVSASLHEGFGLPGLEAMQYGLPLAVSNTEVFNEIYDNAAIYFNPLDPLDIAEKLRLLACDREFRDTIGLHAQERVKNFSWMRTAIQTKDIYTKALFVNQNCV